MARNFANVEVSTDTFDNWVTRTNDLVTALRNQVLTANATALYADQTTGNAELVGVFSANSLTASGNSTAGGLRGGNTSYSNTLYVVSNTVFTPNGAGNTTTVRITANSTLSNVWVSAGHVRAVGNTTIGGNSSYNAITITGNSTFTNLAINAITSYVTANVVISGGVHTVAGNVAFDTDTLFVDSTNGRVGVQNSAPDAELTVTGNANVSGNVVIGGTAHAIAGNVAFDTDSLFVDATNNRVGIKNTTPDAELTITGSANVSTDLWVGNVAITGNLITAVANASSSMNVGANVNIDTVQINIGNSTVNTVISSTTINTDGTLAVLGAATLSNTLTVTGLTTLNGNINTPTANASSGINVGANVNIDTTQINIGNSTVNTVVSATEINTDGTLTVLGVSTFSDNVSVDSGVLFVDVGNNRVGVNNTAPDASLSVTGTANVSGATRIGGATTIANVLGTGNTTVTGFVSVSNTLSVTNSATFSNTVLVTGNATFSNTVAVTGAVALSNTIDITGLSTFTSSNTTVLATMASANVTGAANFRGATVSNGTFTVSNTASFEDIATFQTEYVVDVEANTNIGSGNVVVYSFPLSSYRSAKLMVQGKSLTGNTQMSESTLAHNGSAVGITTYATVAIPTGSDFFDLTAAVNGANVEITFVQDGVANSSVKVVAHLIK